MNNLLNKIEASFKAAMAGQETINVMIWRWGAIAYVVSYFIADKIVKICDSRFVDVLVSLLMTIYFCWHIYALKKCEPKKPVLTKEEKAAIKEEKRRMRGKKLMRKLLLQEPIGDWNPVFITIVIDLFCIAHFVGYIVR